MKKIAVWVIFYLFCNFAGHAQCGEETYELALAQAGRDVVLVRDFKVKLKEGNKKNPTPSSRFTVLMQKGLTYRFSISKDKYSIIEPVLQLFDRNEILGSTFDLQTLKNNEKFEYICSRTGNYYIFVSIRDSKAGCAIGLMSLVVDSAFYAQGNSVPDDSKYILYAGVENPLHIYTDQKQIKRSEITIDRGQIIKKEELYYAVIPNEGPVKINVKIYNDADTIVEELVQDFKVVTLPKPKITIEGADNEYLISFNIGSILKLTITPSFYKIQEFYLSGDLGYNTGFRSDSEYMTYEMINFIKSLNSQQRFFIKEIKVVTPQGTTEQFGPLTYYIR